ncbi:MAG: hypothetical protein PHH54_05340 [Candidatus Nanoarchaeia archaeon]|nr:hypothetical protein [Candidatus Nanoarchaeia archaeon]MDD5741382.1 hypothetical protein [Candidatus Nanoarchaeia archaeon]
MKNKQTYNQAYNERRIDGGALYYIANEKGIKIPIENPIEICIDSGNALDKRDFDYSNNSTKLLTKAQSAIKRKFPGANSYKEVEFCFKIGTCHAKYQPYFFLKVATNREKSNFIRYLSKKINDLEKIVNIVKGANTKI